MIRHGLGWQKELDDAQAVPASPDRPKPGFLGHVGLTIRGLREGLAWQKKFGAHAPKKGDAAPNFTLSDVNGENPVRLSQFFGQGPIALVFGSFT
jgi:hypothetical protein